MVSKTMKCVMAMTYRWPLGLWKSPCRVLSHLFQRECASWEVQVGCSLGAEGWDVGLAWWECTRMSFRDSVLW